MPIYFKINKKIVGLPAKTITIQIPLLESYIDFLDNNPECVEFEDESSLYKSVIKAFENY